MTPDISAETWAGAAAWARGSQVWPGTNAALSANAAPSTRNAVARRGPGSDNAGANPSNDVAPVRARSTIRPAASRNRPTWVETR
jgi:hypothetical protein